MKAAPVLLLCALALPLPAAARAATVTSVPAAAADHVPVDIRDAETCAKGSLPGARCLPLAELLTPGGDLINPRDLLWVLGMAGLTGTERLLVVGGDARRRDAMAGLLLLAGAQRVDVLSGPVADTEPGAPLAASRTAVWTATVRDGRMVLGTELAALHRAGRMPVTIDGRTEAEYWGGRIRAARGGHLPGAQHLPLNSLPGGPIPAAVAPVVYGHDTLDGLALLARLDAAGRTDARVYAAGWRDWAAHMDRPADSQTLADRAPAMPVAAPSAPAFQPTTVAGLVILGLGLLGMGWALGRRGRTV